MSQQNKDIKEFLRKKIRIALLGEPYMLTQNKVSELCEKFFEYGLEYGKNNTDKYGQIHKKTSSGNDLDGREGA